MTDDQSQPQLYNLTRRKVLAGLGTVGLASAGAGLGTSAFYQDIESLTASLQAGKVDLFLDYRATYMPWLSPEEFEAKKEMLLGPEAAGGFERIPTDDGEGVTDSYAIGQAPDIRDSEGDVLSFGEWGMAMMNESLHEDLCGDREFDPEQGYTGFIDALNEDTEAGYTLDGGLGPQGFINGDEGFMFDLADVKPYDEGEVTMSLHLCGNDSYLYLQPELVSNMENSRNEPEFTAGDVDSLAVNGTADPDASEPLDAYGELADYLHVSLFVDENCDNRKNGGMGDSTDVDVALVLDQSGSISGTEYAQIGDAAKLVVDAISASDLSAAVAFASNASLEQGLTTDKNLVKGAIDSRVSSGTIGFNTNIADGVATAQAELDANGRSSADQIIVLLSDGVPQDIDGALTAADAAKTAGIRILTVGFGLSPGSTGENVLRAIAGSNPDSASSYNGSSFDTTLIDDEGDYFFAPNESELDEAFGEVADVIVEGEVCIYEGSLAGLVALADSGEIPLAFDTIVDDGELPAERECFSAGTYCYAFEWVLPCKPEEFEALRSFTIVEEDGFGSFADELEGKGLPLDGNVTQSDSLQVRFSYRAEQCRHNMDMDANAVVLESDATGGIRETDNWITATVVPGPVTTVTVELDGEVYGGGNSGLGEWPSNANSYFMEVNIDADTDGIDEAANDDDFRFGYAAANSGARANAIANSGGSASGDGGYLRRNIGGSASGSSANRVDVAAEELNGFTVSESPDQLTYTFEIDWTALANDPDASLGSAPSSIQVNEVFGGDGGEGVGAIPNSSNDGRGAIDNVTESSGTLSTGL